MNTKLLQTLAFLLCLFSVNHSFSQKIKTQQPLKHVNYTDTVDAPLTAKELSQIQEVYGDKTEEQILNRPQRLKDIKHILRNRIEIITATNKDLSSFTNLSTVSLFNYYNKNISRDIIFNEANFNPLKYQFEFYSKKSFVFRFDNSPYLIVIKSQHQQ